ncbi:ester cyclase, partial [Parvibaculum sp.]|uniref:ester cyclase n=1 Tax=Parvibaculum sp. TaxID=2024848 RepID=UPI00349FF655
MKSRRYFIARVLGVAALSVSALTGLFKSGASSQGNNSMSRQAMIDTFQKHVGAELAGDLETTMATMSADPHLNHVPTMAGGVGREAVHDFYRDHLVGKFFPPDVVMTNISSTVGDTQIVDEIFISFTHTAEIDWLLPGVAPTGRPVEMAVAVVVGFKDGKISHEHIYWDQAGVLVQVGLLDPAG